MEGQMIESYLEITFRRGKAIAAYYYLPRRGNEKSFRSSEVSPGLIVDYSRAGKPIGIEITAPGQISVTKFNKILKELGLPSASREELAPLTAA
jgi:uncharacterized protein YuzE